MKLIIFDLDGTLIDTLQDLATSGNHALADNGYPTHEINAYKLFIGNGIHKLIERILPDHARTPEIINHVKADFVAHYEMHAQDTTRPYPDIINLLEILKHKGYKISIATNKYHEAAVPLVDHYFPEVNFDLVLGHRVGHPAKPDPKIVIDTIETLSIKKENCYYLGDSDVDMLTASGAGVTAIGVTWGFRAKDELLTNGAQYIINNPLELLNIID